MTMSYSIAGIDVHKKMLAVVVADVGASGGCLFQRRRFETSPRDLRALAVWFSEQQVEEAVMESTAQYWRPVWQALERYWQPERRNQDGAPRMAGALHLAQAESNRARRGRKNDWEDAERLVKRLIADELVLSYVPDAEQRLWRAVCRRKYQLTQNRVRMRNHLEGLLEEAQIKLTSLVTDLFGVSGRRILKGLADGERDPSALARLADGRLRATQEQLQDALGACAQLDPVYRELLKTALEELKLMEKHLVKLDKRLGSLLKAHEEAVQRLVQVPGLGVDSGQQILAQIGATASAFASAKALSSWAGLCPGENVSAEKSKSSRSPKGNRTLRRILNQAANAAVRLKGSIFEVLYRRMKPRLGHSKTIGAIAHRLCCLIWKILHDGVRYQERGPTVSAERQKIRTARNIRELRALGYRIDLPPVEAYGTPS
jgi:transposase